MRFLVFVIVVCISAFSRSQDDIVEIGTLPNTVWETSGLINYNGNLITHNDSGNAAELYELDENTLEIVRTVQISNAENIDWEDIAQDANYIYVGDIGNNNGDRQDLGILRILKADFDISDVVQAERISFLYEDQESFETTENSDFDAEALFVLNNNLIVLTKQWQQQGTVAYRIPATPGAFLAERLDLYQVDGLVTGAMYDAVEDNLYLTGYSRFLTPFFVQITNSNENSVFGDSQQKTELTIGQAQVEAITFSNGVFYISSEEFSNPPLVNSPSRLFSFTLNEDGEEENPNPEEVPQDEGLLVYKLTNNPEVNYLLTTDRAVFGMGIFDISGRMVRYTPPELISEAPIDISGFNQGLYYLTFFLEKDVLSAPFFRD